MQQYGQDETDKTRVDANARAVIVLHEPIVTTGDRVEVDEAHVFAIDVGTGDAEVTPAKVLDRAVDEVALEHQVDLAVAWEVIAVDAQLVHVERGVAVLWRAQHVILVEAQLVDGEVRRQVELLDRVDLVAQNVQRFDVLQAEERVLVDDSEVRCLDH